MVNSVHVHLVLSSKGYQANLLCTAQVNLYHNHPLNPAVSHLGNHQVEQHPQATNQAVSLLPNQVYLRIHPGSPVASLLLNQAYLHIQLQPQLLILQAH